MGLFGALSSGVSGLTAQSSALGALSDNIVNVNTVGYKNVDVNFQTLVTQQTSRTLFSAGGVQGATRIDTGVQGLLQATTSQTDIAISGGGFFVVNEAAVPGLDDSFLFTRAGQFFQDNRGFLRNTAGFYLQGFPTDALGNIIPNNTDILTPNVNVISTDFLTTINLARVGGTATATTNIAIGANLPTNADAGDTFRTDVQIIDSLGNPGSIGFLFEATGRDNQFGLGFEPRQGTTVTTFEDVTNGVTSTTASTGQLEFKTRSADGGSVVVDGVTYVFDRSLFSRFSASGPNSLNLQLGAGANTDHDRITALADTFSDLNVGDILTLSNFGNANDGRTVRVTNVDPNGLFVDVERSGGFLGFTSAMGSTLDLVLGTGGAPDEIRAPAGTFTGLDADDVLTLSGFGNANDGRTVSVVSVSADGGTANVRVTSGGVLTATGTPQTGGQTVTFNLLATGTPVTGGQTIALTTDSRNNATNQIIDVSGNTTAAQDVASLIARVIAHDSDYDQINQRIRQAPSSATTILFVEDGSDEIIVDPSGLLTEAGVSATKQRSMFTVNQVSSDFAPTTQFEFTAQPVTGDTITINDITYTFGTGEAADDSGADLVVSIVNGDLAGTLADLEAAIEGQDPRFAAGSNTVRLRAANQDADTGITNDTLVLSALDSGPYEVSFSSNFAGAPRTVSSNVPSSTIPVGAGNPTVVDITNEIIFNAVGIPTAFNVDQVRIEGLTNGAANFDGDPENTRVIDLDFGTIGGQNGLVQFSGTFTQVSQQADGSEFSSFSGVTIGVDGLVTARFATGETRPIFQIPVATFTNTNELNALTGNVFTSTQASGDPTLRFANNGPAGRIIQSSTEASTVDIGQEFTKIIVVQRAFSAATRVITASDELLEELVNIR